MQWLEIFDAAWNLIGIVNIDINIKNDLFWVSMGRLVKNTIIEVELFNSTTIVESTFLIFCLD